MFENVRYVIYISRRLAGHSKWANIRHIKAEKDGKRSQLFGQLSRKIKVAIQDGGSSNPDANIYLSHAIEEAKRRNMPIATIENAIKIAQADKSKAETVSYYIRGPKGCLIIAVAFTDNPRRTKETLSTILRKNGGIFSDNSGSFQFDHKGIITALLPKNITNSESATIDDAIECGAEEVMKSEVDENNFDFICDISQLHIVESKLKAKSYNIQSSQITFIPKYKVEISDGEMDAMGNLIEKLEAHPDVVQVYDNIK